MPNTEKPTTTIARKKAGLDAKPRPKINKPIASKMPVKKEEKQIEEPKKEEATKVETTKIEETKVEKKKEIFQKPKKTEAIVTANNLQVSTKKSMAICKFIKYKTIKKAIQDLEEVVLLRKAIPMRGEIPHRKGPMMAGRYPQRTAKNFIMLLKSLASNAEVNGLENPIIVEAVPNIGVRPFGKFGSVRKKRSHIKIKAVEKSKHLENQKLKKKE